MAERRDVSAFSGSKKNAGAMGLLAGCGSNTESNQDTTEQTVQNAAEETTDDTSEAVANTIAELTDADLFELKPAQPYSDEDLDWTDEYSRVSREHENGKGIGRFPFRFT